MAAALPACYHGAISKTECEALLGKKNRSGAFLIRDSESIQGAMCLCVYKQKVVHTYRMMQSHTGHFTLMTAGGVGEMFFKTLDDLILHYKKRNQGLSVQLRHAVKRKTAMLIKPREPRAPPAPPVPTAPPAPPESPRTSEDELEYQNVPDSSDYVEVLPP